MRTQQATTGDECTKRVAGEPGACGEQWLPNSKTRLYPKYFVESVLLVLGTDAESRVSQKLGLFFRGNLEFSVSLLAFTMVY